MFGGDRRKDGSGELQGQPGSSWYQHRGMSRQLSPGFHLNFGVFNPPRERIFSQRHEGWGVQPAPAPRLPLRAVSSIVGSRKNKRTKSKCVLLRVQRHLPPLQNLHVPEQE